MKLFKEILKGEVYSIYLFAFLIPLNPKWYGFCLLLVVLESILKFKRIKKVNIQNIISFKNPFIWLICFYLFHVIGLWNTSNFAFANMDLGMKSTFVILPLYFILIRPHLDLSKLFKALIYGCLFSLLFYGVFAIIAFYKSGTVPVGSDFSFWMHRGYYAIYLVLAFTFIFTEAIRKSKISIIEIALLLVLFLGTIITESKAGILIILVNAFFLLFYFLKVKFGWLKSSIVMALLCLLMLFSVTKLLSGNNRFSAALYSLQKDNMDVTTTESTTARILMWETSVDIIEDNIITGVGTGDVKDELQELNYKKGYTGVAEYDLNSHNQFLNSWIALGLFGFLSLLGVFIVLFLPYYGENILFVRFLSLSLFLTLMTESFLEVQAGIIPFAFIVSTIGSRIELRSKKSSE